jgi:hypothetical protein
MGQQLNKTIKKTRRLKLIKRRKAAVKVKKAAASGKKTKK